MKNLMAMIMAAVAFAALSSTGCATHEASVKPGVNKEFEGDVDVNKWVERFEGESRETFRERDRIVNAMNIQPGQTVADIGAGTGFYSMLFAQRVGDAGRVYAVDISDEFISHIQDEAKKRNLSNIQTVLCPPDAVNLPAGVVDRAFICDTYHHFEFPHMTMKSLHKAMKPGGELFIVDFIRIEGRSRDWILEHVRAGQEVFRSEIESCGFESIPMGENTDYLKENYIMRFRRK